MPTKLVRVLLICCFSNCTLLTISHPWSYDELRRNFQKCIHEDIFSCREVCNQSEIAALQLKVLRSDQAGAPHAKAYHAEIMIMQIE